MGIDGNHWVAHLIGQRFTIHLPSDVNVWLSNKKCLLPLQSKKWQTIETRSPPRLVRMKSDIDIFHFLQQKAPLPSLCLPLLPFPWLLAPLSPFPPFPFSTSGLSMDGGSMEHTKSSWPPRRTKPWRKTEAKNDGKNDPRQRPFLSLPWYPQIRSLSWLWKTWGFPVAVREPASIGITRGWLGCYTLQP